MSNNTTEDIALSQIVSSMDLYVSPILIIIGTVCNILVVMVMQSRYFRRTSSSFYMTINAIVDLSSLDIALPAHWLYVNFPWIFIRTDQSHYMCKFFNFFGWGTSDLGIILTVSMTTERAIAVTFPLKAANMCTKRRARIVTVVVTCLTVVKEFHFLLTSVVVPEGQTEQLCYVDLRNPVYKYFWTNIWHWIHSVYLFLSFIVIIFSNAVIFRQVMKSGTLQKGTLNVVKRASQGRQLSIMLMLDTFTVVLCTLPFSMLMTLGAELTLFNQTVQQQTYKKLVFGITFYLLYLNRCANFFLYYVSGSRFRTALRHVIHRGGSRRLRQNVSTISRSSDSATSRSNTVMANTNSPT